MCLKQDLESTFLVLFNLIYTHIRIELGNAVLCTVYLLLFTYSIILILHYLYVIEYGAN